MARKHGKDRGLFERPKGSGIWWIRYSDHTGKERRKKVGPKSLARKAYQKQKELVRKVKLGLANPEEVTGKKMVTFKNFVESCIPELRTKSSWKDMRRMAEMWVKGIGHLPLDKVSAKHALGRRVSMLERGRAASTCNRETTFLKSILNRAVQQGLLDSSPLKSLKNLPEDNKRTRIMRGDEESKLRAVMSPENFEVIEIAIDTGIRRGKLLSLPWSQIDLENGWINIVKGKSGSSRQVPMTRRVHQILERRHVTRKSLWVFPNSTGKNHIDPSNFVRRVYKPALEKAGIEDLWIHDMRRTFASRMAMAGKGGRVLTGILGHTSSKTTDRYAHLDPEAFKSAIRVLDDSRESGTLRAVK